MDVECWNGNKLHFVWHWTMIMLSWQWGNNQAVRGCLANVLELNWSFISMMMIVCYFTIRVTVWLLWEQVQMAFHWKVYWLVLYSKDRCASNSFWSRTIMIHLILQRRKLQHVFKPLIVLSLFMHTWCTRSIIPFRHGWAYKLTIPRSVVNKDICSIIHHDSFITSCHWSIAGGRDLMEFDAIHSSLANTLVYSCALDESSSDVLSSLGNEWKQPSEAGGLLCWHYYHRTCNSKEGNLNWLIHDSPSYTLLFFKLPVITLYCSCLNNPPSLFRFFWYNHSSSFKSFWFIHHHGQTPESRLAVWIFLSFAHHPKSLPTVWIHACAKNLILVEPNPTKVEREDRIRSASIMICDYSWPLLLFACRYIPCDPPWSHAWRWAFGPRAPRWIHSRQ